MYIYSILKCYCRCRPISLSIKNASTGMYLRQRYYRANVQHFDFHLNTFFLYESFNLKWVGVNTLTDCVLHMDNTIQKNLN